MKKDNNHLIKKDYLNKINLIKKYNKAYYLNSDPDISDSDYDELKKDILALEKKYSFLYNQESPSQSVGFRPSKNFKKVKHKKPMLSLSNAFNRDDLVNFEKKNINFLSLKKDFEFEYSAEPKIDGISASLLYKQKPKNNCEPKIEDKERVELTTSLTKIENN